MLYLVELIAACEVVRVGLAIWHLVHAHKPMPLSVPHGPHGPIR